jgi:2-polyprenyl-3-methyl-5-hydroxy-6-metoxy-1,4-benzoquinol methylase
VLNIVRLIYEVVVKLASKLGLYAERTRKYFHSFRGYIKGNATVLDVGCGAGAFSEVLARHGCFVVSLDVDIGALKSVAERQISAGYVEMPRTSR